LEVDAGGYVGNTLLMKFLGMEQFKEGFKNTSKLKYVLKRVVSYR